MEWWKVYIFQAKISLVKVILGFWAYWISIIFNLMTCVKLLLLINFVSCYKILVFGGLNYC